LVLRDETLVKQRFPVLGIGESQRRPTAAR
jgi:hypothetical protein